MVNLAESAVMDIVCVVLTAYTIILFVRVLVSWA